MCRSEMPEGSESSSPPRPSTFGSFETTKTYGSASLDKELADRSAVVHGIERGDLVDTHGRHLEQTGNLVHDADAGEAVLALADIEKGHDGSLLVLGRVALQDLLNDLFVLGAELEGDVGVVVGSVAVLGKFNC